MIIPIGHEHDTIRRQPWVTYAVMVLCAAAFLVTHFTGQRRLAAGVRLLEQAVEFHQKHPYLRLDPRLAGILRANRALPQEAIGPAGGSPEPEFAALEQTELDGLTRGGFDALADLPERRFGLVPARFSPVGLVTHMFLHAGFLHLFGNLLFLYLCAPFLEDVWGRPFFAGFYLLAGAISGAFFALRYPALDAPLVGASGAIAGAMGAFLVRHWNRKIRFFYWFGFLFRGTFSSPAWAILPLYFLRELLSAYSMDVVAPGAGGGGVAYWAHVGGFGFGAVTAAALKWLGLEERYLAPSLDTKLTLVDKAGLDRALRVRGEGRSDEAWLLLLREARRAPGDADATLSLWDLAREIGREEEAAPYLARLIREEVQRGDASGAYVHWRDLRASAGAAPLPVLLETRLAEALSREGLQDEAADVVRSAVEKATAEAPAAALVRLARLSGGPDQARLAALVLAHPDLLPQLRAEIGPAAPEAEPRRPPPSPRQGLPAAERPLVAVPAVPLALRDGILVLKLDGEKQRTLDLRRVRAVAAAAVGAEGPRSETLILDLLLNAPSPAGEDPKVIRIDSSRFDARGLLPTEEDPRDAFLCLAGAVQVAGGAAWLIGEDARRLVRYPALPEYERALRCALRLG